jgi:Cation efflux family
MTPLTPGALRPFELLAESTQERNVGRLVGLCSDRSPASHVLGVASHRRRLICARIAPTARAASGPTRQSRSGPRPAIALVGFGFDSTIEVLSAVVVVWQFSGELRGGYDPNRERRALRLIGNTFFVLAGYVAIEAGRDLFFIDAEADESPVGIALAAVSLVVMPVLAWGKKRTADRLHSPTLRADATETLLCSWLSTALLVGLVLNSALGWWWADPVAALAIAASALHEGLEAIRGERDDEPTVEPAME